MAANHMQRWHLGLDKTLWESRDCTIERLAEYFGRTKGSIMSRLQALRDPDHTAHRQLAAYYGKPIGRSELKCNHQTHIRSSPAILQLLARGYALSTIIAANQPLNKGKPWNRNDDVCLYNNRDCPVAKLAEHHGRTAGGIRKRLELLVDPQSTPRQRLFPSTTTSSGVTNQINTERPKKRSREYDDESLTQRASKRVRREMAKTPEEYMDPLTFQLMADPVLVTRSGYTYERATIMKCIQKNGKDPFTQIAISARDLVPNRALKTGIDRWRRENAK